MEFMVLQTHHKEDVLETVKGDFVFKSLNDVNEIRVWYYKPSSFTEASQVMFVMHGKNRNGETYRDRWVTYAKKESFLLLVPQFSEQNFPGTCGYNLGNMFRSLTNRNEESIWCFSAIEDLFDYVKKTTNVKTPNYSIYGHSAGAQFIHRMVMFKPHSRIRTAIAANAGWYTMPTDSIEFPYGLGNSGTKLKRVANSFTKRLIILVGEKDTNKKNLRRTPEAMAQGENRLVRGLKFYETAVESAERQKTKLKWRLKTIPDVGHSNSQMTPHAARLLIGDLAHRDRDGHR